MQPIVKRPSLLVNLPFPYCPGCSHGVVLRLTVEVIEELGLRDRVIGLSPVGCTGRAVKHWDFDAIMSPHGRNPATATAIKRCRPENVVFSYQGDGDMGNIGMAEIVHAAIRCERVTFIFANNNIFGATGGQQAVTTLLGQKTKTTPEGRELRKHGAPLKMAEMLAQVAVEAYIERTAVNTPANVIKTKKAIQKAFTVQMNDKGFSMVEVLCACPSNWGLSPVDSLKRIETEVIKEFPLGVFKDVE